MARHRPATLRLAVLLCFGAPALLAAPTLGRQAVAPRLNLSSNEWPPYYVGDRGLARELLEMCLPATGFTANFSPLSVEQSFPALQSGVLDAHVMSRSPDRDRYLEFGSEPLFRDGYRPIARRDSNFQVKSLRDLDRLRLGHLAGLRYTPEYLDYIAARRAAGTLVEATTNEELLRLLLDGQVDVVINLSSSARWLAGRLGARQRIEVQPYDLKTSDYFLGISRRSRRVRDPRPLLAAFDRCLLEVKRDGRYAKLLEAYDLDETPATP